MNGEQLDAPEPAVTTTPPPAAPSAEEMKAYLMLRRELLATELRYVETYLVQHGVINRVLCAPARQR